MTARDPGLQPERTALAWRRTLLAQVAGGVAMLHLAGPGPAGFLLAGSATLSATVIAVFVRLRRTRVGCDDGMLLLAVAAGTTALGTLALSTATSGALGVVLSG